MRFHTRLALFALALASPAQLVAQETPKVPLARTQNAREIRSLIVALGSDDWGTREAARERLLEIGPEALPHLQRAARDPDPERAASARELLETLRWLVPEQLRAVVGDALDDFPSLPLATRREAIGAVLERSREAPGVAAAWLVNVARFDPDSGVRQLAVYTFLKVPRGDPQLDRDALVALADEPDEGAVLPLMRGQLLHRLGQLDEAIAAATLARERAPGGLEPLVLLSNLLLEADRAAEALPALQAATAQAPTNLELKILLGEALARAGETEAGVATLREVLEVEGVLENEQLLVRLGQAFLRAGLPEEARSVYKDALGRFPYSRELNKSLADVLLESGQRAEALEIYLNEIRYSQPHTALNLALRERLGRILTDGGAGWVTEVDAFFDDAQRGRQVRAVHLAVANWLRRRGLFKDAAREFRLVVALSPGDAQSVLWLGDALRDAGDLAGARRAYVDAQELVPDSPVPMARIRDLGTGAGVTEATGAQEEGSFAFWEARLDGQQLSRSADSVSTGGPPPLVLPGRVVVAADGGVALYGFDSEDGRLVWEYEPDPPAPPTDALPEQIGLELVAIQAVPPAVVAATDPRRARSRTPLVAALANVYWRPANRSWRKARFMGLRAYLIDPERGQHVAVLELDDPAQVVVPPSPVVRKGRALAFTSQGRRMSLELIDLVLSRPLWRAQVPTQSMRRPLLAGDRALVAWGRGVVAIDLDGQTLWRHDRLSEQAEEGEGDEAAPLSTGLALVDGGVVFGTADGRVIRLDLADGSASELARPTESRLTGDLVAAGGRVFVAERGGAIHALDLGPEVATLAWKQPGSKAAARSLSWAGGVLFAINGGADAFADEEPLLQALSPSDGSLLFQRPVESPAVLAAGGELVVVASGGRSARGGLHVIGARPNERIDANTAKLLELESAARDALAEKQYEVSSVLAREYARQAGGYERLDRQSLAFVAKTLARSRRPDEALDVINLAEELGTRADQPFWDEVLVELGLAAPVPELAPKEGGPDIEVEPEDTPPEDAPPQDAPPQEPPPPAGEGEAGQQ